MSKLLGILGGLGPMSSAYLYEMITEHTKASCDQDHFDIILNSRATTPDRTAYITGKSENSPLPVMVDDARRLEQFGADAIVIACNTAHYFIDEIRKAVSVPVPSIISETVDFLKYSGYGKPGILATEGTVKAVSYQKSCLEAGIDYFIPTETTQKVITSVIYDYVKQGKNVPEHMFSAVCEELAANGCDCMILGCTELSVMAEQLKIREMHGIPYVADSLEVLSCFTINMFGKMQTGFDEKLTAWGKSLIPMLAE